MTWPGNPFSEDSGAPLEISFRAGQGSVPLGATPSRGTSLQYPGSSARAHGLADIRVLSREAMDCATRVHSRTPDNAFYCKALARALILQGRLARLSGEEDSAIPQWNQALDLLKPIAPDSTDPAREELRVAAWACLGQGALAQDVLPFLEKRRWVSPTVRQLLGS